MDMSTMDLTFSHPPYPQTLATKGERTFYWSVASLLMIGCCVTVGQVLGRLNYLRKKKEKFRIGLVCFFCIILGDAIFCLCFGPFHITSAFQLWVMQMDADQIATGFFHNRWCVIAPYLTCIAVSLGCWGLALVPYTTLTMFQNCRKFNRQEIGPQSVYVWIALSTLYGMLWAGSLNLYGTAGSYRGLYCLHTTLHHYSSAGPFLFLLAGSNGMTVFFYFKCYKELKAIGVQSNETAKAVVKIAKQGLWMIVSLGVFWGPFTNTNLMGVFNITYPVWMDIVSGLFGKAKTIFNMYLSNQIINNAMDKSQQKSAVADEATVMSENMDSVADGDSSSGETSEAKSE